MTTPDSPFAIRSLIGSAGVGSNGEKLVNAVASFYPPELEAAQQKRPNVALSDDLDYEKVAKTAGVERVEHAIVRGGERDESDAWVSYAAYTADGDTVKGAFPYPDLGRTSKRHVSQQDRLDESDAARDFRAAQAKAEAAAEAGPASTAAGQADPVMSYEDMGAREIVAYLDDHPERKDVIQALEVATQGDKARPSIMNWEPKGGDPGAPADDGDQA